MCTAGNTKPTPQLARPVGGWRSSAGVSADSMADKWAVKLMVL